jgi:hypothetical protein
MIGMALATSIYAAPTWIASSRSSPSTPPYAPPSRAAPHGFRALRPRPLRDQAPDGRRRHARLLHDATTANLHAVGRQIERRAPSRLARMVLRSNSRSTDEELRASPNRSYEQRTARHTHTLALPMRVAGRLRAEPLEAARTVPSAPGDAQRRAQSLRTRWPKRGARRPDSRWSPSASSE